MLKPRLKLYVWVDPYPVSYGSSMVFAIAANLEDAKRIARESATAWSYGDCEDKSDFSDSELGEPTRVVRRAVCRMALLGRVEVGLKMFTKYPPLTPDTEQTILENYRLYFGDKSKPTPQGAIEVKDSDLNFGLSDATYEDIARDVNRMLDLITGTGPQSKSKRPRPPKRKRISRRRSRR